MSDCKLSAAFFVAFVTLPCVASSSEWSSIKERREVVSELRSIARAASQQEAQLRDVKVKARVSPTGESYLLAIKDDRCRLDLDLEDKSGQIRTSYWLDDGGGFFSVSGDLLVIDPATADRAKLVNEIGSRFWSFQLPSWGGKRVPVSQYCVEIAKAVSAGKLEGNWSVWLEKNGALIKIVITSNLRRNPSVVDYRSAVTLDSSKGYVMSSYDEWDPREDKPEEFLFIDKVRSEYEEIAPGVFFISTGTWEQETSGSIPASQGRATTSKVNLVIDSVEFGDFEVDRSYFDIHSWPPIKKGMKIQDNRLTPPLRFTYDEGPFEDSVLDRAVVEMKARKQGLGGTGSHWLIGGNVVAILILGALLYRRKKKDKHLA